VHGGYDRLAEDWYSSMTPDPTIAYARGPLGPTLDFVFGFYIVITFNTLLRFCLKGTPAFFFNQIPSS
jgi:hypothetical protein